MTREVDHLEAEARGRQFVDAAIEGRRLPSGERIRLRDARLDGLKLRDAVLREADLGGSSFTEADLDGAVLDDANLVGAQLAGASMRHVSALRARLEGANLREADLRGADLRQAELASADLRGADLRDAFLPRDEQGLIARDGARLNARTIEKSQFSHFDVEYWYRDGARFEDDVECPARLSPRPAVSLLVLPLPLRGQTRERLSFLPLLALGPSTPARLVAFDSFEHYSVLWLEGLETEERKRFLSWLLQPYEKDGRNRLETVLAARLPTPGGNRLEVRLFSLLVHFDAELLKALALRFPGGRELVGEATGHHSLVDNLVTGLVHRLGAEGLSGFVDHLVNAAGERGAEVRAFLEEDDGVIRSPDAEPEDEHGRSRHLE